MSLSGKQRSAAGAGARVRLRVTNAAESRLRAGHPWLFADSIREQNREGRLGELAIVYDRKDRFLAAGLFDPDSPIRVRVLQAGKPETINEAWWSERLKQATLIRRGLFDELTNGFRWINGESDGWPGLVLDVYDRTLVLKLYTAAWQPRLTEILELMALRLRPDRVVLRLSRNIQAAAQSQFQKRDGEILKGTQPDEPVVFLESGLRFEAEVVRGQKTGFFLDQRENRRRVEALARNRSVLNAFSFSGGFSVYAARGGARSVTDLDISAHALASAERNFRLNIQWPAVAACHRNAIQADAFEWLDTAPRRKFDLIVLDPPSLARKESERAGALRAYERLASLGIRHLAGGGILVASSCSAHVSAPEFFEAVRRAGARSGRPFQEMQTTGHAPDHPARFLEAQYLKTLFLRDAGA